MSEKLLYVGLDGDNRGKNLKLAHQLTESGAEGNFGFKVNLDHALIWKESYLREILETEKPVFVDLKMNNGSRTMSNVVSWLSDLGVRHTNVWAFADENLGKTMSKLPPLGEGRNTEVLGVTFYTRWDSDYTQRHFGKELPETIAHFGRLAVENGCDGIILPANQLEAVKDLTTDKVSPGIRMAGQQTDSQQKQVSDPYSAIMNGGNILVVGSPIYSAPKPVEALQSFLSEMKRAEDDLA